MLSKLSQPEIVIGRFVALCVHPRATLRTQSGMQRMAVLGAYAAASYLVVFAVLMIAF